MYRKLLPLLLLCAGAGAAAWSLWPGGEPPPDPALKDAFLRAALSAELIPYGEIEAPSLRFVRIDTDETGRQSLALRASHLEQVKGRSRAEISVDYPFSVGDRLRYAWEFKLDPALAFEYESDDPATHWWVIAQWHDQPDLNLGETWDDFPSHSPAILFSYGRLDGQDMLGFSYGASELRDLAAVPFARGQWHRLELDVTWSQGSDGLAIASLDGQEFARGSGLNMYNAFQHYFKAGSYRHPGITGDGWVYLRNVQIEQVSAPEQAGP